MKVVILLIILMIVVFLEMKRELNNFRVVTYEVLVPELTREKKAVFLSDMHNHVYGDHNERLLEAVRNVNPDMILVGGDMLIGKDKVDYQPALDFAKQLPEVAPVYYANGNHEQRMKEIPENYTASYEAYKEELVRSGIKILENESEIIECEGKNLKITGLEIPLRCYTHFHKEKMHVNEVVERIGEKDADAYEILLAHNPSYMKQYLQRGADLILSGHLHGGIVRIPGIAGAISPSFEILPKYSGDMYCEDGTDIIVSKGLGTHTINIRFLNPAELVVIRFKGESLV